ncbi:actin-like protein ARP8 [Panicum miliaceum]|uniref:Actin-like protein ARP8 n=1 Tax=Panicum miliaceum TaxID=4540 RepID=A0A3L6SN79_PANMI|nr:actin-like protein ARP8 [Panicum miliaceum]
MNQFFRATIDGKDGDPKALRYYACNLLARTMPEGRPFCIMDFIWNELRRAMSDPNKFLQSAPYIMYMTERLPRSHSLRIASMSHFTFVLAPAMHHVLSAPLHAGATRNLRFNPPPSYVGASSSSRRGHNGSFTKRVLKSIFCMCKSMTQEVNENRRDIIEIKSHLGLPYDPYNELPEFDNPFTEWDAADEAAVRILRAKSRRLRVSHPDISCSRSDSPDLADKR